MAKNEDKDIIVEFGPKRYRLSDLVLFIFFNALPDDQTLRFFREFELDEDGVYKTLSQTPYASDIRARDNWVVRA